MLMPSNKTIADYLRMLADKIEDGYIYNFSMEENHGYGDWYSDGPFSAAIYIPSGLQDLRITWQEGPKKLLKEQEKTTKKQPINDLDTALSMLGDVVSSAKDFDTLKRNAPIMIDMIRERYCGC